MTVRLPIEVARKKRERRVEEVVERRKEEGRKQSWREIARCAGDWRANWEVKAGRTMRKSLNLRMENSSSLTKQPEHSTNKFPRHF